MKRRQAWTINRSRWGAACGLAGVLLAACGGGSSDAPAPPMPAGPALHDATVYSSAANASLPAATEAAAVTHHSLTLGGQALAYTASAGHLSARDPASGAPEASLFYVAYTADGAPAGSRPLVFFYNGGPGSSTVWLHLGSFAPRRIVTNDPLLTIPLPYQLVDNAESLIDSADLVFVDAVGTGYSEALAPRTNQSFWSVDADAALMRDFIARYVGVNQRALSPTFIFGESYGTTRSALLANLMVTAGMRLDGVILQSSILDYNTNCEISGPPPVSCAGYLPSYALTGAWFQLLHPNPAPTDTYADSFAQQMRSFTDTSYAPAVNAFLAHGSPPAPALLAQLVDRTGAALALWTQNFDLGATTFRQQLLSMQLLGRYDARIAAANGSALSAGGDPSSTLITAPFTAAQRDHLANELQYTAASSYTVLGSAINTWDFRHDGEDLPDVIPDLATALAQHPTLRILSLAGQHDLATPFHQTELDLARLGTVPGMQQRVYPGGHMTYLDDRSRPRIKADIVAFIRGAAP